MVICLPGEEDWTDEQITSSDWAYASFEYILVYPDLLDDAHWLLQLSTTIEKACFRCVSRSVCAVQL